MAPKRPGSKQQQQLNVDQYTLLKKPMEHLGKQLNVPVMVGFNKKVLKPQLDAIKDKYYEMFRNKSGKETRV
jgi:hypothetical protein